MSERTRMIPFSPPDISEAEINEVVLEAYYKAVAELEANAEVVASETKETAAE